MKKCPNCGTEWQDKDMFCGECGTSLTNGELSLEPNSKFQEDSSNETSNEDEENPNFSPSSSDKELNQQFKRLLN